MPPMRTMASPFHGVGEGTRPSAMIATDPSIRRKPNPNPTLKL
jgi:hypothetical protein